MTDIRAEDLPKVTYQAARLSDSVAQLDIKGGQIITWPHLSAAGRAGLSEGLGPVLRLVPWQSTSSLLPAVARESWGNSGGQGWTCPLQAAPGCLMTKAAPHLNFVLSPHLIFPLVTAAVQHSASSWPCHRAKFQKHKSGSGKIAKASEMAMMAVTESCRRKTKQVP